MPTFSPLNVSSTWFKHFRSPVQAAPLLQHRSPSPPQALHLSAPRSLQSTSKVAAHGPSTAQTVESHRTCDKAYSCRNKKRLRGLLDAHMWSSAARRSPEQPPQPLLVLGQAPGKLKRLTLQLYQLYGKLRTADMSSACISCAPPHARCPLRSPATPPHATHMPRVGSF